MLFLTILFVLGIVTGGTASIVGFGIGSFLTPVLALKVGFGPAVAAVGIAHFFGSAVRFWLLKKSVNRKVLFRFGILSAIGGLLGALLQGFSTSPVLALVFGCLMIFAGVSNLTGWSDKFKTTGFVSWLIGGLSGFFGGLVGNQGGLRAAGLVEFKLSKTQFVATATAVALAVDIFRVPVYIATRSADLNQLIVEVTVMTAGVIVGTFLGAPLLHRLPQKYFKLFLSAILVIVGILVAIRL